MLDEADFYFQQTLYDEAKGIYLRILEKSPGEQLAIEKLKEIAQSTGQAVPEVESATSEAAPSPDEDVSFDISSEIESPAQDQPSDGEFDLSAELDDGAEQEDFDLSAELAGGPTETTAEEKDDLFGDQDGDGVVDDGEFDLSAELESSLPEDDATAQEEPSAVEEEPDGSFDLSAELEGDLGQDDDIAATADDETSAEEFDLAAELSSELSSSEESTPETDTDVELPDGDLFGEAQHEESFDIAGELSNSLDFDGMFDSDTTSEKKADDGDFDMLAGNFSVATNSEIGQEDFDTRYSLAIGYKEMGMYDLACAEFELAKQIEPSRAIDCIIMIGLCLREKGEPLEAIKVFKGARLVEEISEDGKLALSYEISLTLEAMGQPEKAFKAYQRIMDKHPDYRDGEAKERFERLKQELAVDEPEPAAAKAEVKPAAKSTEEQPAEPTPISPKVAAREEEKKQVSADAATTKKKKKRKKVSYI
jgi:tetratricopeptide (TPR) repeat protein